MFSAKKIAFTYIIVIYVFIVAGFQFEKLWDTDKNGNQNNRNHIEQSVDGWVFSSSVVVVLNWVPNKRGFLL